MMYHFFSSLILHTLAIFLLLIKDINKINYLTEQIKKKSIKEIEEIKISEPSLNLDNKLTKKIDKIDNQNLKKIDDLEKQTINYKIKRIYKKNKLNFKNKKIVNYKIKRVYKKNNFKQKNIHNLIKTFVYIDEKFKKTNNEIKILFIFDENGYIKSYRFINYNHEFLLIYKNIRLILNSDLAQSFHNNLSKNSKELHCFNF